jgi:hypothetical protein
MSGREYRNDDGGYLEWLAAHADGYVINIGRSHRATNARLHRARCTWIRTQRSGGFLTEYVKICGESLAEVQQWAADHVGEPIAPCGTCHPDKDPLPSSATATMEVAPPDPVITEYSEVYGPDGGTVVAWAADYVRFEDQHRPTWQKDLHTEIKTRGGKLRPTAEQVLHATFFGEKKDNADVENLVLYSFGSFGRANGASPQPDEACRWSPVSWGLRPVGVRP